MKHTQEKWNCNPTYTEINNENGGNIVSDDLMLPENAILLAAAPELLSACRAAYELVMVCRSRFPKSMHNPDRFKLELVCAEVFGAISKAVGRK